MQDPIARFTGWLNDAKNCTELREPTAMTLATADGRGRPSARVLLLKDHSPEGFVFYTNLRSRKSHELAENPYGALCFYWMPLNRQVRIEGPITRVDDADADAYFASRPRDRQLGAWASHQSEPLATREELDARYAALDAEYAHQEIPRPPHWSGWKLAPESIEFWSLQNARLHDRELYRRTANGWEYGLLNP